MARHVSIVRLLLFSNISETIWPLETIFHIEPPGARRTNTGSLGHMTKMANIRIYGENTVNILFFRTERPMTLKQYVALGPSGRKLGALCLPCASKQH